jgi:hypothetical protein
MAKRKAMTIVMDGYIKWARLRTSEMDTKFVPDGQYNAEFYPEDQENLDKIMSEAKERGKQIALKDPYDGEGFGVGKYFKIYRNHVNRSVEEFGGPPAVLKMGEDYEGTMTRWDFETDGLIGNGSKVRVKLVMYGDGNMAGHRLEKLGVLDLVSYVPDADMASGF